MLGSAIPRVSPGAKHVRKLTDDIATARALARGMCRSLATLAAIALTTLLALAAAVAFLAVPAAAAPPDPNAVHAKTVRRGRVVVGVGPALAFEETYLPLAGRRLELRLYGRGPIGVPASRLHVRLQPPGRSCARPSGRRIPVRSTLTGPNDPDAVTETFRVRRAGFQRVCVYAGRRTVGNDKIRFFGRAFGAVHDSSERHYPITSPDLDARPRDPWASWNTNVQATIPYTIVRSGFGCRTDPAEEFPTSVSDRTYLASHRSATGAELDETCGQVMDRTVYSAESGPLWTVDYGSDQALSPDRPVAHSGACVPHVRALAIYDARRHIEAQGCRVGRIVAVAERSRGGNVALGAAYAAVRNGEEALIAPQGTTVDLVVNGRPRSALTGVNPTVTALLRRYGDQSSPGETRVTGYSGPRVPGRNGVVLIRYFIPSATAAGGLLKGDGRSFSSDPAAPYRAALLWDPTSGRVDFRVAGSCRKGVLGFLFDSRKACKPALELKTVGREEVFESSDSRRATNLAWIGGAGAGDLDVRFSILNSYTNSLPGFAGAWSVDQTLTISQAPTPTGFALRAVGNGYPALEAWWVPDEAGAVTQSIARRDVEHPHVAAYKVPADRGGGDAALDRVSWATCESTADGSATVCRDRHNGGRTWTTPTG